MLPTAANALVRLLLDPRCAACEAPLVRPIAGPVCDLCWASIGALTLPLCARCGDSIASGDDGHDVCLRCRDAPLKIECVRSVGRYDGTLRQIVHAFKYDSRRALASPLASLMRKVGHDVLAGAAAVVPVPLHPWRAVRRGFNQADDLARELGIPVWRVLARRKHSLPQAGLPAAQRYANVSGAFTIARGIRLGIPGTCARRLQGASVVLIDDVMTTGATLDACAGELLGAGVRTVRALTIARAVGERPRPRPRPRDLSTVRRR